MFSKITKIIGLSCLLCMASQANAHTWVTEPSDSALNSLVYYIKHALLFTQKNPQEKVYLHFDNTGYFKGETMYFKAYAIRTDTGQPSDISKVLYVELLNPSGDVAERRKIKMVNGVGNGEILLDSVFGTGFYEVRAFTRYMMNWGGETAFSRVFPIYRKPAKDGDYSDPKIDELSYLMRLPNGRKRFDDGDTPAVRAKKRSNSFSVTFYPEGGDLVQGVESRVAFNVLDEDGRHAEVMGILLDPQGNDVTTVSTAKDGRGLFLLKPQAGTYKLVLTTQEGKRMEFNLPEAKKEGCVLNVDALGDFINCRVSASPNMCGTLLAYTLMNRGTVLSYDTLTAEPNLELEFKREDIRPGVNQITVFAPDGQIMAERLFFICPPKSDNDSIFVTCETPNLSPCSKVKVTLKSEPNSFLSFSAMDAATMTDGKVGNAQTWMLLSSDVKGYIENPDYYFEADDLEHRKAADMLMMVQGWRRYDWKLYTGVKPFSEVEGYLGKMQPIEDRLYVHGFLKKDTNKWRKKHPVDGVELDLYLYNQGGAHYKGETVTDSLGNYAFQISDEIEGEWNMQLKTRYNDKAAAYQVAVDRHFSPAPRYLSPYETEPIELPEFFQKAKEEAANKEQNENLLKRNGVYVIPTVKIKKRYFTDNSKLQWYDETTGARKSTIFYNVDEATEYIADQGETLPTLYNWLMSKNEFFSGDDQLRDMYKPDPDDEYEIKPIDGDIPLDGNYTNIVFKGGLSYKNRPIIWIVNNMYVTITNYRANYFHLDLPNAIGWSNNFSGATPMPDYIDEVKSVYISEDQDNFTKFIRVDELPSQNPVTVYVYTHPQFFSKEKGTRRTYFQGYNAPETFKMEDYSVMPPMEDFRRTLFWEPEIKTNEQGYAYINFFNNSSCQHIYFSVEGMAPDGHFLVNE